ncbi:MAG: DUF4286 family protein [Crocinitomicaceae bacterium]|nr:DUF4286 family protein [Crocinitomicaceae bacterium]
MILYNVTVSIDPSIHENWLTWMRTKHVPDVMATGCFIEARISRVHEEEGGFTFAMSYVATSQDKIDAYQKNHAAALQSEHNEKYAGKVAAFRTMLTILEEFKA